MSTPDGRYHLIYNGEIYNYVELRSEICFSVRHGGCASCAGKLGERRLEPLRGNVRDRTLGRTCLHSYARQRLLWHQATALSSVGRQIRICVRDESASTSRWGDTD
jgi:hypothetical protein